MWQKMLQVGSGSSGKIEPKTVFIEQGNTSSLNKKISVTKGKTYLFTYIYQSGTGGWTPNESEAEVIYTQRGNGADWSVYIYSISFIFKAKSDIVTLNTNNVCYGSVITQLD